MLGKSPRNIHHLNTGLPVGWLPVYWLPVGWLPVYDPARSKRPGTGYEGHPARSVRLFHDCFKHLLQNWNERTKNSQVLPYGDDICRQTRFFLGGLLGDAYCAQFDIFCIFCKLNIFCIFFTV